MLSYIILYKFKGLIQRFLQCPYYKSQLFQNHYLLHVLLFISVYCKENISFYINISLGIYMSNALML